MRPCPSQSASRSPAAAITAAIAARLEQGVKPWVRPWGTAASSRPLRACGTPYRGINTFWLWLAADCRGYASSFWMTYRQAQALGGQVRKGEQATIALFYKTYAKRRGQQREDAPEPDSASASELRRVLRSYAVFNAEQIDHLPARYYPAARPAAEEPVGREAALDVFFAAVPAALRQQGDEAYYEALPDRVTMPPPALFSGFDHYYATLAHELAHWTGHPSRLARDLSQRFGSRGYAAEELVAELASAIIGAELGLPVAHLDHHASYVAHWIELLKTDERAIFTAAARAEEAAAMILRLGGWPPRADAASGHS
jgi:antirestriction protein ArdC